MSRASGDGDAGGYATTIGLEIHAELATRTKLFCGCEVAFGGEPNTRVCPVCLGHPGTLPVPNERAVEYATKIAIALGCEIAPRSIFHRKNYFYPDMPKNYQISQYDIPIGSRGSIDIEVDGATRTIGITRVHLEEDTGKTIHQGGGGRIHEAEYSLEDFNRAGTPLVEIVTEPDLTSPDEARALANEVRAILEYLEVSDVRMEEGSLRFDANISVAPPGGRPGIKAEIKNMNSIRSLGRALTHEVQRQQKVLGEGGKLEQSTRHWDEEAGVTTALRTKEYAFDYRYFPEPDLVPIEVSVEWMRQLSEEVPELPSERRRRFVLIGLTPYDAGVLASARDLAGFFEEAAAAAKVADVKRVANLIANDLRGRLAEREEGIATSKAGARAMAELADLVAEGTVSATGAKEVLAEMIEQGRSPTEIVESKGLRQVSDRSELEALVDRVIEENPQEAERIRGGEDKPVDFLMGRAMKASAGRGNPAVLRQILLDRLRGA